MIREARQWQPVVDGMSDVGRLVHLAMRYDGVDTERVRVELLDVRKRAYENELTRQAQLVGCTRQGMLGPGAELSALNEESVKDAASIANTYNYDLAIAIQKIRAETPTANRYVYARRLREWEAARAQWKTPQIRQYATTQARNQAQADFARNNNTAGVARLVPTTAVCPVCKGIIARGWMPLRVAQQDPPPYHPNCPHLYEIRPERVPREECIDLWMGG
jgi:hypothetical protein